MKPTLNELLRAYMKRWQDSPDIAGLDGAAAYRVLRKAIKTGKRTPVPPPDRYTEAGPPTMEPVKLSLIKRFIQRIRGNKT